MKNTFFSFESSWRNAFAAILFLQLLFPVVSKSVNYGSVKIGGGGFVTGIITSPSNPDLIFARTDVGGAYKWNNLTRKWMPLLDDSPNYHLMSIEGLAVDEQDPNRMIMYAGRDSVKGYILRSWDGGSTFRVIDVSSQFLANGNGGGRESGECIAIDPHKSNIVLCGSRYQGLFKSTDYGETWSRIASSVFPDKVRISFVLFDKSSASDGTATPHIYVALSRETNNLYVSNDGGSTWSLTTIPGLGSATPKRAVIANGNLFITYGRAYKNIGPSVFKRNMVSGNCYDVTPPTLSGGPETKNSYCGIGVNPLNSNQMVVTTFATYRSFKVGEYFGANSDLIYRSNNGGTSWENVIADGKSTLNENGMPWIKGKQIDWISSAEFDPNHPGRVFVTSGRGVYMTENIFATPVNWQFMSDGIEETVVYSASKSVPGGPFLTCLGDITGFMHDDVSVSPAPGPLMKNSTDIDYANTSAGNQFVRVGGNGVGIMYNDGDGWKNLSLPYTDAAFGYVSMSRSGRSILWCPQGSNKTYKNVDRSSTWTVCNGIDVNCAPRADKANANYYYYYSFVEGKGLYKSSDGGDNFSLISNRLTGRGKICLDYKRSGYIWFAMLNTGLYLSTDGGATINQIPNISSCLSVSLGASGTSVPYVYFVGTYNNVFGVYMSKDDAKTWSRINDDEHRYGGIQFVDGDKNNVGRVYCGTLGRGIIWIDTDNTRSVMIDDENQDLGNCAKISVYPTLFSNNTVLDVAGATEKKIAVYNQNGLMVQSFNMPVSQKTITLGDNYAAGIYVVKITTENQTKTIKIVKQ